jgi:Periplasmic binding protein
VKHQAVRITHHIWAAVCCVVLAACSFPGSVKPTVKIGLSAPFEGQDRDLGYEVLYAVRLAVRQRNEAGGVGGRYFVEFVALNDFNEAEEAITQARKMAVDPGVLAVLGGWSAETAEVAASEYGRLGLPFVKPEAGFSEAQPLASQDEAFVAEYEALSGGVPPGPIAAWAYAATNRMLDALDGAVRVEGIPTRLGVGQVLSDNS